MVRRCGRGARLRGSQNKRVALWHFALWHFPCLDTQLFFLDLPIQCEGIHNGIQQGLLSGVIDREPDDFRRHDAAGFE